MLLEVFSPSNCLTSREKCKLRNVKMCDNCTEFQNLLYTVEREYDAALQGAEAGSRSDLCSLQPVLSAADVNTSLQFLNVWHHKQCMCVFR